MNQKAWSALFWVKHTNPESFHDSPLQSLLWLIINWVASTSPANSTWFSHVIPLQKEPRSNPCPFLKKRHISNGPKLLNHTKSTRPWSLSTYVYTYTCYSICYVYVYIHRCTATMWPEAMTKLTKALRIHGWHQQTSRSCQPLAAKLRIAYQMPSPINHHPMHLLGATGNTVVP